MEWQTVFAGAVAAYGGLRPAGRLLGVSPSTVSRLARGDAPDPKTAKHIGPLIGLCPTCEQSWPAAKSSVLSLEEEVNRLREALKPFANGWLDGSHTAVIVDEIGDHGRDARRALDAARTALKENMNG